MPGTHFNADKGKGA